MTTSRYISIESGPSREELFDALKYAYDKKRDFKVSFTGVHVRQSGSVRSNISRGTFTATINGIQHEDGSGQSFIIYAQTSVKELGGLTEFYYNARTRTGRVNVA